MDKKNFKLMLALASGAILLLIAAGIFILRITGKVIDEKWREYDECGWN